jgi:gamma-glutamyltranspeptidase/glutathione hydrolase
MERNGGLLSSEDFANYRPVVREPLVTTYRGRTLVGFPPPSSGGVHVAQILNILENFDVAAICRRDAGEYQHLLAEAMKLAFADRAYWLGDPDFARVPKGLADKAYAKTLAAKIDLAKATSVPTHGKPPAADENVFQKHTTHVAAADAEGNWVAMTQTVNTSYGCKVIVPGTGVVLNNQMDDFAIAPGTPNSFGLVGAEANAVAPGKRPLSSMSPTIVLENGKPILSVGAAGGPTIITQVVQALVRRLDLQLPLEEALLQPRIHHQWSPDAVRIESKLPATLQQALTSRGHKLTPVGNMGVSQAIEWDAAGGMFLGMHDPRVPGKAAGP